MTTDRAVMRAARTAALPFLLCVLAGAALATAVPFAATAQTDANCWLQTHGAQTCVTGEVGTAGPVAGEFSSTTMLKAEMKQGLSYDTPGYREPTQTAALMAVPKYAPMAAQSCGPANVAAITDEYGHKYNCRGDRIR